MAKNPSKSSVALLVPIALTSVLAAAAFFVPLDALSPGATEPPADAIKKPAPTPPATLDRSIEFSTLTAQLQALRTPIIPVDEPLVIDIPEQPDPQAPQPDLDWIYAGYMTAGEQTIAFLTIDGMSSIAVVGDTITDARNRELTVQAIDQTQVKLGNSAGTITLLLATGSQSAPTITTAPAITSNDLDTDLLRNLPPEQRQRIIEQRERNANGTNNANRTRRGDLGQ